MHSNHFIRSQLLGNIYFSVKEKKEKIYLAEFPLLGNFTYIVLSMRKSDEN